MSFSSRYMTVCRYCWRRTAGPAWLGETAANDAELKAMLKPYPGGGMTFWPVDRRVGNVRNDSPDLFAPCVTRPRLSVQPNVTINMTDDFHRRCRDA